MKNHPEYVKSMRECSYHNEYDFNLHHLEGDVWSHTMMAYSNAIKFGCSDAVKWAVLLHDLGRIKTRYVDKKKKQLNFGDFEGVSQFIALEILNVAELSDKEKILILKIISYHYTVIDYIKYEKISFVKLLEMFEYEELVLKELAYYVKCDLLGRIIDKSREEYYDVKKMDAFIKQLKNIRPQTKEQTTSQYEVNILVGPPCSRKSSWIKGYKDKSAIVINRDRCVEEIGLKYGKKGYNNAYTFMKSDESVKKEVDALDIYEENVAKATVDKNIIIDNPNLKFKNREEWILALKKSHKIKVVLFLTPYKELLICNQNREKEIQKAISETGLLSKLKTFSFPLLGEGIDEVNVVFN